MPIRLLNARKLAVELVVKSDLVPRAITSLPVSQCGYWSALPGSRRSVHPWTWMSLIETAALIVVYLLGFSYAYDAAGGDENRDFVVQFTCLYLPVSVTTVAVVWGAYWSIAFGFREWIIAFSDSYYQFAVNLSRVGSNLFGALTLLAVLMVQAVTFYRITKLLEIVRTQPSSIGSSLQQTPARGDI